MSLASYPAVTVTAVAMSQERNDLRDIARVQWADPHGGLEDSSIDDIIRWLDHRAGIAYVANPDGSRGPRIRVVGASPQRYIRSNPDDEAADALLRLPRLDAVVLPDRSRARRAARQPGWRWSVGRRARPAM
ncbi:hypothetical protein GCM10029976_008650 [Kribbella albertanoniae]|uniref:DUF3892 domain-containing protein n=1 Tax=Kribbella albertanoniae TaxID=1266829 RepID=A0A4V2XPE1_9ACTN|nr:DUF3892 domain-containing protein [Kribbella albertanoniae]TDC21595.1 DUF3892 domain-containing protein [Kribbella albertanoniae]